MVVGKREVYFFILKKKTCFLFQARLYKLQNETGIDSFKFDAGEINWFPESFILNGGENAEIWPELFTTKYAEALSENFGRQIEVRVGRRSQKLPVFVRMLDKFSDWTYDNGLKTMVTTLLQMGIAGWKNGILSLQFYLLFLCRLSFCSA